MAAINTQHLPKQPTPCRPQTMNALDQAILTTVAYWDVFAFAPRPSEIQRFLVGVKATQPQVELALAHLAARGLLGSEDGLWFLAGKNHLAPRRLRFSQHSAKLWPKAYALAEKAERTGLAVCGLVTGSLAADNADEHADIDFLFIYPRGRTWTSFAAIRLVSKLPGLESLCPNYVLSEDRLQIRPQNLFTAWELAKAVPMFGFSVYRALVQQNRWVDRYLPNALPVYPEPEAPPAAPLDKLIQHPWFQKLEKLEQQRKYRQDHRDVGVDLQERAQKGSMDRHSPTRSYHALSELRYRMQQLGVTEHPVFGELGAAASTLGEEMVRWGSQPLPRG